MSSLNPSMDTAMDRDSRVVLQSNGFARVNVNDPMSMPELELTGFNRTVRIWS